MASAAKMRQAVNKDQEVLILALTRFLGLPPDPGELQKQPILLALMEAGVTQFYREFVVLSEDDLNKLGITTMIQSKSSAPIKTFEHLKLRDVQLLRLLL